MKLARISAGTRAHRFILPPRTRAGSRLVRMGCRSSIRAVSTVGIRGHWTGFAWRLDVDEWSDIGSSSYALPSSKFDQEREVLCISQIAIRHPGISELL